GAPARAPRLSRRHAGGHRGRARLGRLQPGRRPARHAAGVPGHGGGALGVPEAVAAPALVLPAGGRGLRGVRGALRDRGAAHARLHHDRHGLVVRRHRAHEAGAAAPPRVPVAARGPGPALRPRWLAVLAALAALAAVWGFAIEPNRLVVRETRLELPRWPAVLDGLRLGVVADIHAGAPWIGDEKLRRLVAEVNGVHPDLVVLLGDFVVLGVLGGRLVAPERTAETLARLHAPLGVVAILGNHDWWYDGPRGR